MELPLDNVEKMQFKRKPKSIPPTLRPLYVVSLLAIVLKVSSRGEKASIAKLQLFYWVLQDIENRGEILTSPYSKRDIIRFSPFVNRALIYGEAIGIFEIVTDKSQFVLTEKGDQWVNKIINEDTIFLNELAFLAKIRKSFSEKNVDQILKGGFENEVDFTDIKDIN